MRKEVILNKKEQRRLMILNKLEKGEIRNTEAAELLCLSERHIKRLRSAYRAKAAEALAHGNRGKKPANTIDEQVSLKIVALAEGMLVQIDGSPHAWLEGRGPKFSLIGAIDDATGKVVSALFRQQEDAQGYFLLILDGSAYRQLPAGFVPEEAFCFKYRRTVGKDNVVRFANQRLQILPSNSRPSYAYAHVTVHEHMDGSLSIHYQGKCLLTKPTPPEAPKLRARTGYRFVTTQMAPVQCDPILSPAAVQPRPKSPYKPSPNHPWRQPLKIHNDRG